MQKSCRLCNRMRLKFMLSKRMMSMRNTKSYSELIRLKTFEERYEYLRQSQIIGEDTFGRERYLNQIFYGSQNGEL